MTYAVKRQLGYGSWGVTNPWVYANLAQPQRRRVPSKYVWQTHPPRAGMHPLGQIPGLTAGMEALTSAEARARRMEIYSILGLTLTTLFVVKAFRPNLIRNMGRRKRR